MIKRISTILLVLLFAVSGVLAQTGTLPLNADGLKSSKMSGEARLTIGTIVGTNGMSVAVPITAQDFSGYDLGAITLKIGFDNSRLSFSGITPYQDLTGWGVNASGGILTILNMSGAVPIIINDGLLMELNFVYYSTGVADIIFKPGTEVVAADLSPLSLILTNGQVMPDTPPATLSLGKVNSPEGTIITVPLNASGFDPGTLISAITLKIGFPASKLIFQGLTPFQGFAGGGVSHTSNQVTFLWSNSTGQIIEDGLLFELKFYYLSGVAPVVFNAGVEFIDINFSPVQLQLINGYVDPPLHGQKINGILKYANIQSTPLSNSTVELWNEAGTDMIESTLTDEDGSYLFVGIAPGNYILKANSAKPVGGIDIDDALDVLDFVFSGVPALTGINLLAADFNQDGVVDLDDALDIFDFSVSGLTPENYIPWIFEAQQITVADEDISVDIQGLCSGDVNASYDPIP